MSQIGLKTAALKNVGLLNFPMFQDPPVRRNGSLTCASNDFLHVISKINFLNSNSIINIYTNSCQNYP